MNRMEKNILSILANISLLKADAWVEIGIGDIG